MDKRVYGAVMIGPGFILFFVFIGLVFYLFKNSNKAIDFSTSVFTKVLYYSVEGGKKKLYFLDLQITDRKLAKELSFKLCCALFPLLSSTCVVFVTFLVVEMSYECTEGFDCYKSLDGGNNPVNCEATPEDVSVTCYRFAFNPFLASGLGYGVLKVGVAAIHFCSLFILWLYRRYSNAKCICNLLVSVAVILFIGVIALIVLNEYFSFISPVDSMKFGVTILLLIILFILLVGHFPWSQLAKLELPVEDFRNDARSSGSRSESVNPKHNTASDKKLGASSGQVDEKQTQRLKPAGDRNVNPQENKACDENLGASSCELDKEQAQHNMARDEYLRSSYRRIGQELSSVHLKPVGGRNVTSKHNTACD